MSRLVDIGDGVFINPNSIHAVLEFAPANTRVVYGTDRVVHVSTPYAEVVARLSTEADG